MRVVAGLARGRRLVAPPGRDTRPTGDRVRQAVFNSLDSLGAIDGATVLDLFAGSGALGIEALSRGAEHATFVETARPALDAIRANLAATGFTERATVVAVSAGAYLLGRSAAAVDVALVDPPYSYDEWDDLVPRIPAQLLVAESDRAIDLAPPWRVTRIRNYGSTVVTLGQQMFGGLADPTE